MACNACRDKRRKKVLHVAGEGAKLCESTRSEYPLVEGRFEAWADAESKVVAKSLARIGRRNTQW